MAHVYDSIVYVVHSWRVAWGLVRAVGVASALSALSVTLTLWVRVSLADSPRMTPAERRNMKQPRLYFTFGLLLNFVSLRCK